MIPPKKVESYLQKVLGEVSSEAGGICFSDKDSGAWKS